jgi:cobalt-zinc-cadmium efflux system membrane fusion protein
VEPGIVRIDQSIADSLGIQTEVVEEGTRSFDLTLPGEVLPAPDHFAVVSAPTGGRVAQITAHEGEAVRRGQVVLQLESAAFAEMTAGYQEAEADVAYYQSNADRAASLVEQKISPQASLDKANAELSRSQARVSAAYSRLRALDVPDEQIRAGLSTARERPLLPVYAPISGFIDRHDVDLGTSVNAYQEMLSIVDPRFVLVRGFLAPEDASRVAPGSIVHIEQRIGDPRSFQTTVSTVAPALDETNRSLIVNIVTEARDRWPVPGQTVRLRIEATSDLDTTRIPADAIVYDGDQPGVFVRIAPNTYRLTIVSVVRLTDEFAFVSSGLSAGDEIAVNEVFSLKALVRFGEYAE